MYIYIVENIASPVSKSVFIYFYQGTKINGMYVCKPLISVESRLS